MFCMSVVEGAVGYIIERLFIGCSLAAFVICQFWSSIMFSPTVVGMANAVAGGWGNAGESAILLYVFSSVVRVWLFLSHTTTSTASPPPICHLLLVHPVTCQCR